MMVYPFFVCAAIIISGRPTKSGPVFAMPAQSAEKKVRRVMAEFEHHHLHSGSKRGPLVKSKKQALAIAYSEARKARHKHAHRR